MHCYNFFFISIAYFLCLLFPHESLGQGTLLNLEKLNSLDVTVRTIPKAVTPCGEEDCCERSDTFFIRDLNVEIYSFYRSGIPCDPYLEEIIVFKNEKGIIKEKYHYNQFACIAGDWFCEAAWVKEKLSLIELKKLLDNHMQRAMKIDF